jgi:hypothetical protein
MKELQVAKIRQLGKALVRTGHSHLDDQASVLGLSRSTTWSLLHSTHKNYGLSAAIINQILAQRELPAPVRRMMVEYVEERCAGMYGHNGIALRRFCAALGIPSPGVTPHHISTAARGISLRAKVQR